MEVSGVGLWWDRFSHNAPLLPQELGVKSYELFKLNIFDTQIID